MDGPCNHFLTGSGLTEDQGSHVGGCNFLHDPANRCHTLIAGNDARQNVLLVVLEASVFLLQLPHLVRTLDDQIQGVGVNGLLVKIVGAHGHSAQGVGVIVVSGYHDNLCIGGDAQGFLNGRKAFFDPFFVRG